MSKLLCYIYHVKLALSDKNSNIGLVQFYNQQNRFNCQRCGNDFRNSYGIDSHNIPGRSYIYSTCHITFPRKVHFKGHNTNNSHGYNNGNHHHERKRMVLPRKWGGNGNEEDGVEEEMNKYD